MRVRAKEVCFIDNMLLQPGEEFDYTGKVGSAMEVISKEESDDEVQSGEDQHPAPAAKRGPGRPRKVSASTN